MSEENVPVPDTLSTSKPVTLRYIPIEGSKGEEAALKRIATELAAAPPTDAIKRKDGFDYLHGYYVFGRANFIFGALNISYRHVRSSVVHLGTVTTRSGERSYVVCECTAGVEIILPGDRVYYTEGTATCDGMGRSYGDAFNIANKGAFTDARKIAFRPLGKTFGSDFSMGELEVAAIDYPPSDDAPGETKAARQKNTPAKRSGPGGEQEAAAKPPLDPVIDGWWKEIKVVQETLGWSRKTLADYTKELFPDTPASELAAEQLTFLHKKMVAKVTAG